MRRFVFQCSLFFFTSILAAQQYDIAINGGRILDPETGLDAVRNVAITGNKIFRVTTEPLTAKRVIDARGLVVTPGFIDLHQHSQDADSQRLKALDGVTTALEMEIGAPDVAAFLRSKEGHALINYGTTASHSAARGLAFGTPMPADTILLPSGHATDDHATPEQLAQIYKRLESELDAGALGIGIGLQYVPGATRLEIIRTFELAARRHVPVFTHVRSTGYNEPGSGIEAINEVIGAAAVTGAPLHIAHINSSCRAQVADCLSLIEGARAHGLEVTTEAYPYVAGATRINSALFNPGWQEQYGITYHDIMVPGTGERLTKERFDELHNGTQSLRVVMFVNTQPAVDTAILNPLTIIASDGGVGHPRNAGTYTRVLARYVRSEGSLTLMAAIRKMTLMPALVLQHATQTAAAKGRLQEGADADITVFDPATVADQATYESPSKPSVGVRYLLVGGIVLVDGGNLVPNVFPGKPVLPAR